jgi:hypothetical protein
VRENAKLNPAERNRAVDDLIELVAAVDGILQGQAPLDADYFVANCKRKFTPVEVERLRAGILKAYRWQFIGSGVQEARFTDLLGGMITEEQSRRISTALGPILSA